MVMLCCCVQVFHRVDHMWHALIPEDGDLALLNGVVLPWLTARSGKK